ncbi:hypothetical protein IV203_030524 [Nitzschia inconspicua]|uniref:Uncharacterized protein n=1 Tax=Nitzschia inconspicua TaxID=303405 RepID=A0A9K3Q1V6_9STRA|nr:hypothetical protein IV203_030524 [Nitzschia inconspicua]
MMVIHQVTTTTTTNSTSPLSNDDEDDRRSGTLPDNNSTAAVEQEDEQELDSSPSVLTAMTKNGKCVSCGKMARKDCTFHLCIKCCTDDSCISHTEQRQKAKWKEQVMTSTTPLQLKAQWKRSQLIHAKQHHGGGGGGGGGPSHHKRLIREPNFQYLGDTVVIWDIRQCFQQQPTVKDDILRKAHKRKLLLSQDHHSQRQQHSTTKAGVSSILRNNRKRFRTIMERLYRQSIGVVVDTTADTKTK